MTLPVSTSGRDWRGLLLLAECGCGSDALADLTAGIILHSITAARTQMLARYELALEATRRHELRASTTLPAVSTAREPRPCWPPPDRPTPHGTPAC